MQSFVKSLGDYGCYLFCLINLAEEINGKSYSNTEIIDKIFKSVENGYCLFNFNNYADKNNFFVTKPHKILELLTGRHFEVRKENGDYVPKNNEYLIEFWSKNNGQNGHFARINQKTQFNSLQKSTNVNDGSIYSVRVFKEI